MSQAITPLHHSWSLLVDAGKCPPGTEWLDIVKLISSFASVESFWSAYNNVVPPSSLNVNSTYHLFRKGIKPMWEDPSNAKGGKWVMSMPRGRGQTDNVKRVDEWWMYTVLAMVGETMGEEGKEVCGAVVSIRKSQDKLALWINTTEKTAAIKIGQRWKDALKISDKTTLRFQAHADAVKSNSSFNNKIQYEV